MNRCTNRSAEIRTTAGLRRRLLQLAVLLVIVAGSFGVAHGRARLAAACCDNAVSSVSGSPNPATTSDTVTITAQVCETTAGIPYSPGGYVTLSDTSANPVVVLGTPVLVGSSSGCSTATLTTTSLSVGDHAIKLVAYPTATDTGGAPLNGGTDRIYTQTVTTPSSGGQPPISIGSNTAPTAIGCIYCDGQARFLAPGRDGYVGVGAAAIPVAAVAEPGGTLKKLSITISSADAGFWSFSVLVNQAGTSIGCGLAPGALTCVDASLAHAVTLNSGDTVELAIGNPGTAVSPGSFSVSWTLELDPSAATPPAPVITAPANGATSSTNSVVVSGTGVAGASISVLDNATQIASTVVDGAGTFSSTATLGAGLHTLTARQTVGGQLSPLRAYPIRQAQPA